MTSQGSKVPTFKLPWALQVIDVIVDIPFPRSEKKMKSSLVLIFWSYLLMGIVFFYLFSSSNLLTFIVKTPTQP